MIGELTLGLGTLLTLFVFAVVLLFAVRALRWATHLLPLTSATRAGITGAIPLVEIALGGVFLVLAVERVFRGSPVFAGIAVVGVLFFGLWLGGDTLKDVVSGVLLRTGGSVGVGDRVRFDGLEGRVTALGYRVLTLELGGGDESLIPYSKLSRTAIVRTPHVFGAHRHTFWLPAGIDTERIRTTALLSHWSSVRRSPVVEPGADGIEVTVFALDPDHGPTIEAFVRNTIEV